MRTLGSYRLVAEIGRGGMANVYLATNESGQLLVIKQPRLDVGEDDDLLAMFLEEARLGLHLEHPNVVRVHDVGHEGEQYFIVMEYLDGQPLSRVRPRLMREDRFVPAMLAILRAALEGLHYAHEATDDRGHPLHLVHRDATPQNIFVTYDGGVKLVDFGIAKAQGSNVQTRTGVLKGKLKYMPPEQVANRDLDRRADLYAIGVVLWEMLAQRKLFRGMNDAAVIHQIASGNIPDVYEHAPNAPAELVNITMRAMAPVRDNRFPSARAMAEDLDRYIAHAGAWLGEGELQAIMARQFDEERRAMKTIIANHIEDVRESSVELPRIPSARISMTPSTAETSLAHAEHVAAEQSAARRRTLSTVLAIGASAAVAAALAVGLRDRASSSSVGPDEAIAAPTPPSAAQSEASPTPAATRVQVRLRIEVTPADAEILLDGDLLSTGSYDGPLPKSGTIHRVTVRAEGYQPRVAMVDASTDTKLSLELAKRDDGKLTPTPRHGARRPPPPAPASKPEPSPSSDFIKQGKSGKGSKAIDTSNPYQ